MERKHTISVLVENEFGVLARVAGLFSSKGYNIDSLSVSSTNDPSLSRMTIVTHGSDHIVDQIIKQLNKLINVITVEDLTREKHITREMLLVKVSNAKKDEILKNVSHLNPKVLEENEKSLVLELTGDDDEELNHALYNLQSYGILEVVRTGMLAIQRGEQTLVDSAQNLS